MVYFENLMENKFDLTSQVAAQGWETYFDRLKGPVYPSLVKDFWKQAVVTPSEIKSSVMGKPISISERSIAQLYKHDGKGKRCYRTTHFDDKLHRDVNQTIIDEVGTCGLLSATSVPNTFSFCLAADLSTCGTW